MATYRTVATVGSGAATFTTSHTLNTSSIYIIKASPNWNTTVWWTSKTASTAAFAFGTQAPSGTANRLDIRIDD